MHSISLIMYPLEDNSKFTSVLHIYIGNEYLLRFFYLSLAHIPPFFPQQLSPVLPQFPFSFFPWPSARFEPTLLFSSGVPVCLPYHDYLLRFTG